MGDRRSQVATEPDGTRDPAEAPAPAEALRFLAAELRAEETVISPHVVEEPGDEPALGLLAAAGPRAAEAPGEYALLVESIREGYLLHYEESRLLRRQDRDLSLLAGDYLYARGLRRLAALRDSEAVGELSDLISLSAQTHADRPAAAAMWLASVAAVACGGDPAHQDAKAALREGRDGATAMRRSAERLAARCGLAESLRRAAEAIESPAPGIPRVG